MGVLSLLGFGRPKRTMGDSFNSSVMGVLKNLLLINLLVGFVRWAMDPDKNEPMSFMGALQGTGKYSLENVKDVLDFAVGDDNDRNNDEPTLEA